jgi:hypothetical protein
MTRRGRSVLRMVGTIAAGVVVAVIASALLAYLLLRHSAGAPEAMQTLQGLRAWSIPAQLALLGLLWIHWPRLAEVIARWRPMSAHARDAFVADRKRIFVVLALFEVLVVLRALSSS